MSSHWFNNGISLDDNRKESQTPPSNGHTASSFTQSSVKVDSTTPVESPESKKQKQQINWIDQIDDPLLKPHPDDELIAQMFDNIGKQWAVHSAVNKLVVDWTSHELATSDFLNSYSLLTDEKLT